MLLTNRVAIITGGARGMGRAIALKFAEEGCSIVIADILQEAANNTVNDIAKLGRQALFVSCDVSNSQQVQAMVKQALNKFGKIDILVNDAGTGYYPNPIAQVSEAEWERTLAVNLKGVFLCCKAVTPYMKEQRYGKIVNICSISAISPVGPASYSASKGGLMTLTMDVAMEMARYNICANAILPGITRTEMIDSTIPPGTNKEEYYDRMGKELVPMQRVGTPQDIAKVALFLACDLSDYVTGDRILVGGGAPWRAHLPSAQL